MRFRAWRIKRRHERACTCKPKGKPHIPPCPFYIPPEDLERATQFVKERGWA